MMTEEPYEVRSKAYYGDQLYVLFIPFNLGKKFKMYIDKNKTEVHNKWKLLKNK